MQIGSVVWEEFDHIHTYTHTYTRNRSQYTRNAQYQTCFSGFDNNSSTVPYIQLHLMVVVTDASIATGVGRVFSRVCLSVCLLVRTLKGKRLVLPPPNLVHIYSIAVAQHALNQRSKSQRSRSHLYENCLGCYYHVLLLPAWVYVSM